MKGTPLNKSKHFDNLKNLSKGVPAECEYIQVTQLLGFYHIFFFDTEFIDVSSSIWSEHY